MAGAIRRRTTKPTSRRATLSVGNVSRSIPDAVRLCLYVRAGGRCQFDGCDKYLLRHSLTRAPGNYGQMGHIIAFSARGPRGKARIAKKHINDLSNLMLLCSECHKLVDTDPGRYSERVLREFKKRHEARILDLTGRHAEAQTTIFILQGNIGAQAVQISEQHLSEVIAPRYQEGDLVCVDLTTIADGENASFWDVATYNIRSGVERLYERRLNGQPTPHISVFALGPIPLLIYLGSQLSNKVPVHLFQRHRDTEDWTWKTRAPRSPTRSARSRPEQTRREWQASADKQRQKTNLEKHIAHIRDSGVRQAIRLAKLWNVRKGLGIKTFVLELFVVKVLREKADRPLAEQFWYLLEQLRDHAGTLAVEDPANPTGNDLSELLDAVRGTLSWGARMTLALAEASGWEAVFGALPECGEQDQRQAVRRAVATVAASTPVKPWACE